MALLLVGCGISTTPNSNVATTVRAPASPITPLRCDQDIIGGRTPNFKIVNMTELIRCRPEVKAVMADIRANGPFDYGQDNGVFQNREGYLPAAATGTYREYTVITPGASTRGARRLITAGLRNRKSGEYETLYYTDDHYETFLVVVE
ncbi:MAG: ribonuclease N1 [Anaerolineae bacterium]|nr:ribonuclease N1 [Anaerolineae bacterium]